MIQEEVSLKRILTNLAKHIAGQHPEAMVEAGRTQRQIEAASA
jgi:hypothetical protein